MSIGFATLASAGSSSRRRVTVGAASSGRTRPAASHASAARMPSPPAFVSTATRRPGGSGWVESSVATSISSSSDAGANDAGLVEERVDRGLGPGERGRVRARGALARRRRAALERENRLPPRHAPCQPPEPPRVSERLDVQEHEVGLLVVLPPLEQIVRGDVRLVADRREGRETEPARLRRLEHRQAERAGLGREADVAARRGASRERRVQSRRRRPRRRGSSGR